MCKRAFADVSFVPGNHDMGDARRALGRLAQQIASGRRVVRRARRASHTSHHGRLCGGAALRLAPRGV